MTNQGGSATRRRLDPQRRYEVLWLGYHTILAAELAVTVGLLGLILWRVW